MEFKNISNFSQKKLAERLNVRHTAIFGLKMANEFLSLQLHNFTTNFFSVSDDYLLGKIDNPTLKGKEFHLSVYIPADVLQTSEGLKRFGQRLIEIAERLEKELEGITKGDRDVIF